MKTNKCFNKMCIYCDETYKRSCANPAIVHNFNGVKTEGAVHIIEVCEVVVLDKDDQKPLFTEGL